MKLHYFSSSIIPSRTANSIHVMKMCQSFSQAGHTVTLHAMTDIRKKVSDAEHFSFYGINKPFRLMLFKNFMPIARFNRVIYIFRTLMHILHNKSDIVYCRDLFGAFLCLLFNISVVYELHSPPITFYQKILFRYLKKSKHTKLLVYISAALSNICQNKKYNQGKQINSIILHDGVDIERFQSMLEPKEAKIKLSIDPDKLVVGYTGHLYKGRGFNIIKGLAKRYPEFQFIIVGGTEDNIRECKAIIETESIHNIIFYGFIPNGGLDVYWAASDILLMPYQKNVSVSTNKGNTVDFMSPLKMFEYMATGKPIISSDLPVLHEVLCPGMNCLMAQPDVLDEWIQAIWTLSTDHQLYNDLSKNELHDIQQYSWSNRARLIVNALKS